MNLKKQEKIKIIWCGNCDILSQIRPDSDKILDFKYFHVDFPKDIPILLKSRKYSKNFFFKILRKYLNFIFIYYKFFLPANKTVELCLKKCEHPLYWIFSFFGLYIFFVFCGYWIVLTFPLFVETNSIFLPILLKNPNCIYLTSVLPAIIFPFHEIHFDYEIENLNQKNVYWLFPHLKSLKSDKERFLTKILFFWCLLDLLIVFYVGFYLQLFLS